MFLLRKSNKCYDKWVDSLPNLSEKTVVLTGTTSGTGFAAASAVIKKNAKVLYLLNRTSTRSKEAFTAMEEEKEKHGSKTELRMVNCDLMSFDSVRKAAAEVNEDVKNYGGLNVIGNNAGIMGFPDNRTKDGYDQQIQVNHLSHFLLTKELMPSLMMTYDKGGEVRIVQQSSTARNSSGEMLKEEYFEKVEEGKLGGDAVAACFQRYHQSKLSNATFAMSFHDEIKKQGLDTKRFKSVCAEPGWCVTGLGGNLLKGHENAGFFQKMMLRVGSLFIVFRLLRTSQSAADGSLSILQGMFGEDVNGGDFLHPSNNNVGNPKKMIAEGKVVEGHDIDESLTLDQQNKDMVWKKSVEACGEMF